MVLRNLQPLFRSRRTSWSRLRSCPSGWRFAARWPGRRSRSSIPRESSDRWDNYKFSCTAVFGPCGLTTFRVWNYTYLERILTKAQPCPMHRAIEMNLSAYLTYHVNLICFRSWSTVPNWSTRGWRRRRTERRRRRPKRRSKSTFYLLTCVSGRYLIPRENICKAPLT